VINSLKSSLRVRYYRLGFENNRVGVFWFKITRFAETAFEEVLTEDSECEIGTEGIRQWIAHYLE
jgi:hypothetical protein